MPRPVDEPDPTDEEGRPRVRPPRLPRGRVPSSGVPVERPADVRDGELIAALTGLRPAAAPPSVR